MIQVQDTLQHRPHIMGPQINRFHLGLPTLCLHPHPFGSHQRLIHAYNATAGINMDYVLHKATSARSEDCQGTDSIYYWKLPDH